MSGPYRTTRGNGERKLEYSGSQSHAPISDMATAVLQNPPVEVFLQRFVRDQHLRFLHRIDNQIFSSACRFFENLGAEWCNLPLTTLMISSPGEVYGGQTLDYTTDTLPVELSWFDSQRSIFLAESSQFYLELRLLVPGIEKVFSIYNSFRKERADFSHLSEFQHIEFEGHVDFKANIDTAQDLICTLVTDVLQNQLEALSYFRTEEDLKDLEASVSPSSFHRISFRDAMNLLREDTGDSRYEKFSLEGFGAWEEVRLTEILGGHVWVTNFPLLQIPFYHDSKGSNGSGELDSVAENADLILAGYREVVGSGRRIANPEVLARKAEIFNLPPADYEPYLAMRRLSSYRQTCGFGLGWQRFVHWLLKLPTIWDCCHVPRGHFLPSP